MLVAEGTCLIAKLAAELTAHSILLTGQPDTQLAAQLAPQLDSELAAHARAYQLHFHETSLMKNSFFFAAMLY